MKEPGTLESVRVNWSSDLKTGFAAKNSRGDGEEGKIMISEMIFQASLTLDFCKEFQLTIPDYEKHVRI